MKITRHFVYVCSKRVVSKTYGGSDYTLQVYENKGKGKLVHIGERKACTRAHRGEESEAWSVVTEKFPRLAKKMDAAGRSQGYWSYSVGQDIGVTLQNLGGC